MIENNALLPVYTDERRAADAPATGARWTALFASLQEEEAEVAPDDAADVVVSDAAPAALTVTPFPFSPPLAKGEPIEGCAVMQKPTETLRHPANNGGATPVAATAVLRDEAAAQQDTLTTALDSDLPGDSGAKSPAATASPTQQDAAAPWYAARPLFIEGSYPAIFLARSSSAETIRSAFDPQTRWTSDLEIEDLTDEHTTPRTANVEFSGSLIEEASSLPKDSSARTEPLSSSVGNERPSVGDFDGRIHAKAEIVAATLRNQTEGDFASDVASDQPDPSAIPRAANDPVEAGRLVQALNVETETQAPVTISRVRALLSTDAQSAHRVNGASRLEQSASNCPAPTEHLSTATARDQTRGAGAESAPSHQVQAPLIAAARENVRLRSLDIQLHPAELGTVRARLRRDPEGRISATLAVETEAARQALASGLDELRQAFERAGLVADRIDVVADARTSSTFAQANQQERRHDGERRPSSGVAADLSAARLPSNETTASSTSEKLISLRA